MFRGQTIAWAFISSDAVRSPITATMSAVDLGQ